MHSPHRRRTPRSSACVTVAVLFVTEPVRDSPESLPTALLPFGGSSVLGRLRGQLTTLGVTTATVVARPEYAARLRQEGFDVLESANTVTDIAIAAQMVRDSPQRVVICSGDVVTHAATITRTVAAGSRRSVAVVGAIEAGIPQTGIWRERNRVVSVETRYHRVTEPNATFNGVMVVAERETEQFAQACDALLDAGQPEAISRWGGATELMLLAAVRQGIPIVAHEVRHLFCARVADRNDAAIASDRLHAVDEQTALLRSAIKEDDDLFATFAVSSFSPRLVRIASRWRLTPTQVTWLSVALALGAAMAFAIGDRGFQVAGAVLLYLSFVFDCVDGQLARFTGRYSAHGAWLDAIADRGKEFTVYAGLAVGAAHTAVGDVWPLALSAMVLQTARHMTDTWYGAVQDEATDRRTRKDLHARADGFAVDPSVPAQPSFWLRLGTALGRLSTRAQVNRWSALYWLKRTLAFPIGERWLLIGVTAAFFNARVTFTCLLFCGAVAAAYTLSGRILRARALRAAAFGRHGIPLHRDSGPIDRLLGHAGRGVLNPLWAIFAGISPTAALLVVDSPGLVAVDISANEWAVPFAGGALLIAGLASRHPHDGPLDWLVPAALRAAEYLFILLASLNEGVPAPLTFALIGTVALFHYDLAARHDTRSSPLGARHLGLGWDLRVLVLATAATFDFGTVAVGILTTYLAATFVVLALLGAKNAGQSPAGTMTPQQPMRRDLTRTAVVER